MVVLEPDHPRGVPVWIRSLDWVIVIAVSTAILVELAGGLSWRGLGLRLSIASWMRPGIIAALGLAIRYLFRKRPSTLERLAAAGWLCRASPALGPRSSAREIGSAAGFLVALLALALHQQVLRPFGVPDYGDPLFSTWRLAWVSRMLFADPLALFDANIFYPERNTLAFSDPVLLPSLFAAPLFRLGVPHLIVYQVVFATALVTSGIALFVFVRRLTSSPAAGLVSASIFALYPFRFEHYSHLELQMTMWMPIGLMVLHRVARDGGSAPGAALGLIVGLQTLCSLYFGVYFAVYLAFVFLGLAIVMTDRPWRSWLRSLAAAAVVAALLAWPLVPPYLSSRSRLGERAPRENAEFSAMPSHYLAPHRSSAMYGTRLQNGPPERALFPGMTAVALAATALVPPLTTVTAAYGVALLASFDASLGFNRSLYPFLYDVLLPFRGLRVPARFSMLVGLSLAILAGLGVARLTRQLSHRRTALLAAAVIALIFVECHPVLTLAPAWRAMPAVYGPLLGAGDPVVAVFPMSAELGDNDAKYMYFSTWHWKRLVNGYSGTFPASYARLTASMREFPSHAALEHLKRMGVQDVVLHGEFMQAESYDRMITALDGDGRVALVREFAGQPRPSRLYRVQ